MVASSYLQHSHIWFQYNFVGLQMYFDIDGLLDKNNFIDKQTKDGLRLMSYIDLKQCKNM